MKDQFKNIIEKRLRSTKVTESGVDPKFNKTYDCYLLGLIRGYENVLSDLESMNSGVYLESTIQQNEKRI